MEALIVLLLLFLAFILFVFPIWTFVKLSRHGEELRQAQAEQEALREELRKLKAGLASAPPAKPESASAAERPAPAATAAVPPAPAIVAPVSEQRAVPAPSAPAAPASAAGINQPRVETPTLPPLPPPLPSESPVAVSATAEPPPPPVAEPPSPARPRLPSFNWEQFMGVKLFAWLGGFALFLGAVFFLKLSIEQGWISPELRVAMGFLLGVGLVTGGMVLSRKNFAVTGQTLCATGVVTLYAITFACRALYHFGFFGPLPTFALMILITTTAFFIAVRLDARVVALLGMLGGFLTPVLISTGQDNPLGLFTYIALLDIGLVAVALHRRWDFLVPLAAIGTAALEVGWASKFLTSEKALTAMIVCLVFDVLFLAAFAVAQRKDRDSPLFRFPGAGLVLVSFAFALYLGQETAAGLQPGRWLGFVFLSDLCLLALAWMAPRAAKLHLLAGAAVFLLLGVWTYSRLNADLLGWALGAYLLYAVLHSAFPLVLLRLRPDADPGGWHQAFAPLAMLLVLGPVLNSPYASFAVWPAILILDLLAIVLAWLTASVAAVGAVLVFTLIAAAQSIFRLPLASSGNSLLLVIAGFAVLFFFAGLALVRRWAPLLAKGEGQEPQSAPSALVLQLPAMSSLLPFVLLIMASARLALTTPNSVFGLALLLVVLTLGLARILRQGLLPVCSLAGVLALVYIWNLNHFSAAAPGLPLAWYLGFYVIFTAYPFVFYAQFRSQRLPWIVSAAAGPLFFPLVYGVIKAGWPGTVLGLIPAAFALPSLACLIAVLKADPVEEPRRLGRLALFGGVALLFITLIFPIQFERQWITIAWAVEGVALLWLFHRVPHRGLPIAALILLGTAFVRLALNPAVLSYHLRGGTPIFNWYLYAYGVVVLCLLAGARLLAPPRERVLGLNTPPWLNALGGILLFLLVNIEIADYFSEANVTLTFQFSGNFARDMSYTLAWALFALGLLILGIWKRERAIRYAGMALLAATLIKLYFHDLARLGQVYRIVALMAVAVIAILASFLYQRFVPTDEKKPDASP
ncbi:hypothetical protein DB347_13140 [Opitutaceae bacterium EW11]|nr:hypothetical protein DB347_13140 [Opitutaceae bacterium EW11]